MVGKSIKSEVLSQPELSIKRQDATTQLNERIQKGKELLNSSISNATELDEVERKGQIWHEYNEELLSRLFSNSKISQDYTNKSSSSFITWGDQSFYEDVQDFKNNIQRKISNLESVVERIPLFPEAINIQDSEDEKAAEGLALLHPLVIKECIGLMDAGYYAEAVEKSFKIVRDKLRVLTGYETSSEAFGKGYLFIKGAAASNVESDFQEAVKFLGMSIDYFRNEKVHSVTGNVSTLERGYQYLVIASIALYHLDNGEIRKLQ